MNDIEVRDMINSLNDSLENLHTGFIDGVGDVYAVSGETIKNIIAMLKKQEAVVRCRDCKRRGTYDCPVYVGGDGICSEPDDWFCSDGEQSG